MERTWEVLAWRDDGVGDGRPALVVLSYDAASVRPEHLRLPDLVERLFRYKGQTRGASDQHGQRNFQNNLVFLVADETHKAHMKDRQDNRLALEIGYRLIPLVQDKGGNGQCGTNCQGFCTIAVRACPAVYSDEAACESTCAGFSDAEAYDASDVSGDTLACRLYHLTVATVYAADHCPHIAAVSDTCK